MAVSSLGGGGFQATGRRAMCYRRQLRCCGEMRRHRWLRSENVASSEGLIWLDVHIGAESGVRENRELVSEQRVGGATTCYQSAKCKRQLQPTVGAIDIEFRGASRSRRQQK